MLAISTMRCTIVPMLVVQLVMLLEMLRSLGRSPAVVTVYSGHKLAWRHVTLRLPCVEDCAVLGIGRPWALAWRSCSFPVRAFPSY